MAESDWTLRMRYVFHVIHALGFTDSMEPVMDKIYYFSKKTESALEKSIEYFNCNCMFGGFAKEMHL